MADLYQGNRLVSKKLQGELPDNWHGKSFIEIVFEIIQESLEKNPDQEWLRDAQKGDSLFVKEISSKCLQAVKVLASYGLQEGDVVHLVLPSCIEFHVTVFAIWLLGGIASLTDPSLRTSTLLEQIKDIEASFVLCHSDHELNLPGKTYKVIKMENIFGNTSLENVPSRPDFSIARRLMDKSLVIFWSSGTTGKPKGIAHGKNFFIYSMVKKDLVPDTLLQTTWFFHAGGFFFAPFNEGLYNGFEIVFMNFNETMTTDSLLPIIHEHRPWTIICSSHHAVQLATITNYSKVRFMSYLKCSNWCQISKLSSNFGCLFTFFYLDEANSIKTDLHICKLLTGQFVSYKFVI